MPAPRYVAPSYSPSYGGGRRSSRGVSDTRCGNRRYCGQMRSCREAQFYYRQCGVRRLDGDRDGVPCESLCG
ncbi:excalibur calcium-binding domain-containing protein [uncultured Parasphingopyxis sp.]|uniref:excalibur calcium-binding domain-containing protein n=1 Tax=uncultured Parasphingopyxis sp. TaxID=1547918 RepID=UPI00345BC45C